MIKKPKMEIDDCSMTIQIQKDLYDDLLNVLIELHDLIEDNMIGAYKFDSISLQPLKKALLKAGCTES